jgi:caffeoyl-CoA O-methyltransferase
MTASFDLHQALRYIDELLPPELALPVGARELEGEKIQPTVGALAAGLLDLLVRLYKPQCTLEIGTSYGYSTAVLGRAALTCGGHVQSIEINPRLAEAARENIRALGLQDTVEIICGDAREVIQTLPGSFGLIVQDGHKPDYLPLLDELVSRLDVGGLLISDDVLFPVMDIPASVRDWQDAMHNYNLALRSRPDLKTVWLPIGDGVALSLKAHS